MSLDILPNEIIIHIARSIDEHSDLQNLSLCSRHLNQLIAPAVLFRSLRVNTGGEIFRLLRLVLRKPELRKHVKALEFPAYGTPKKEEVIMTNDDDQRFHIAIATMSHSDGMVDFHEAFKKTSGFEFVKYEWDTLASLLFLQFPNLEDLKVHWNEARPDAIGLLLADIAVDAASRQARNDPSAPLKLVKNVSFFNDSGRGDGSDIADMVPFLDLESVTNARIEWLVEPPLNGTNMWMTRIQTLVVDNCFLDDLDIETCLGFFKSLKKLSLRYTHCEDPFHEVLDHDPDYEGFTAEAFRDAIEHLEPCLEELTFKGKDQDSTIVNDLSEFENLRTLSIEARALMETSPGGIDPKFLLGVKLPDSLVLLELHVHEPWVLDHIQHLLDFILDEPDWFFDLETIILRPSNANVDVEAVSTLVQGYASVGVRLMLLPMAADVVLS